MGPKLIGLGTILIASVILGPIFDLFQPLGKFWWPEGNADGKRERRVERVMSVVVGGIGVVLVVVGIVLHAGD